MDGAMATVAARLDILAPLSGVLVALDSVPDPVFAQKLVGDGVSLDPTSAHLLAPVAGVVTVLHKAHHALTIRTDQGVDVLVHIGIDTVQLAGAGFTPQVRQGDRVQAGQCLISFDIDYVARHARCLLTQIVITNGETVRQMVVAGGMAVAGETVILSLELAALAAPAQVAAGGWQTGSALRLPNLTGLHARPAAVLTALAKTFQSEVRVTRGAEHANAKSLVAVMALGTQCGDLLEVAASGPDAQAAIAQLSALLADGCGERADAAPVERASVPVAGTGSHTELAGVAASPGLAVGRIVHLRAQIIEVEEIGEAPASERARLERALREARRQIALLKTGSARPEQANILAAHQELLDDPDLIALAIEGMDVGKSAAYAWRAAFFDYAHRLERLEGPGNAVLRERASDIRDVGQRVLAELAGVRQAPIVVPEGSILVATTLTPSDTAALDRKHVLGFCTTSGGATSHVAILARSLGIPAICGIDAAVLALAEGTLVVLDGSSGLLECAPNASQIDAAHARVARQSATDADERRAAAAPALTTDAHRIEVAANVRHAEDALEAVALGAEGVGLLRSEFLFDERASAPDEQEQARAYMAVAAALGRERALVVRTLDVGGDKPLSYLPLPKEENPFLGLRGVRVSLDQPQMFRVQLRAILQAAPLARLHIMFPMVATLEELREAKAILAEEQRASGQHDVQVGIMIEVPSAALMAEQFAREADFFSIGTNDLTQYTLAMDRGHPKLAKKADGLHPAVLKMIELTCQGARAHGKWVGVCGGMASDPLCVPVLIGLGVQELSVSVPAIPAIKALIRRLSLADCQALAQQVVQMGTATEVRARLTAFLS
jgi:phosphoenolpyruvate-protein phosphotransferase